MSVIIKGLKMPKNCGECIWIQRGYPDWCDLPMGRDLFNDKKRPDWCPLIEVPTPHGPLIDADYDRGRYEALRLIASAYFGKDYYFDEPDGMIYSRESHAYMTLDDAIAEFMGVIGE